MKLQNEASAGRQFSMNFSPGGFAAGIPVAFSDLGTITQFSNTTFRQLKIGGWSLIDN